MPGAPDDATPHSNVSICSRLSASRTPARRVSWIDTSWSATAMVLAGQRVGRPTSRSPSEACELVTSWDVQVDMHGAANGHKRAKNLLTEGKITRLPDAAKGVRNHLLLMMFCHALTR